MNICPNCGGDIDALKEMFPDGWTTCEELERRKTMKETKFRAMAGGVMVYFDLFTIAKAWDDDSFQCKNHLTVSRNSTLMEYTGLKDKNGVEIYEGDLLDVDTENRVVKVVWFEPQACFDTDVVRIIDKTWPYFPALQNSQWNHRCEVIGNIHEGAGNGS